MSYFCLWVTICSGCRDQDTDFSEDRTRFKYLSAVSI
ncbi:uncharacterized protein DC041_0004594 [Schistosoma bovis]|uniref:Uncharacterized protein n=1 Tax=Schistosoma bovis TaxID=6184 RepID=A0A430Q239_SCHBO|nr:uncharacterized protein DC041_0004594 [Schistosoma bovis]